MVASKRCKICCVIDADNVLLNGEYFGKKISDIILRICGFELDPHKAREALVCQTCIFQLVYTDAVVEKLRKAVLRLKKNVRQPKLKNSAKKKSFDTTSESYEQYAKVSNVSFIGTHAVLKETTDATRNAERCKSTPQVEKDADIEDDCNSKSITPTRATPLKKSNAKRKPNSSNTETINSPILDDTHNSISEKRIRTLSSHEEFNMDLTVEQERNDNGNGVGAEKPRNCILCGKVFHSKRALRDHIEVAHMGERLKACPHCSSEFRSQQKYESHVFSEKCKNSNHACQFLNCNKRFKTLHKMELHMQHKHSSSE